MLTVNSKELLPGTPSGDFILNSLEEIKKLDRDVYFEDARTKNIKERKKVVNARGEFRGFADTGFFAVPNIIKLEVPGYGNVHLGYSEQAPIIDDKIVKIKRQRIYFKDSEGLNPKKQFEKIFFLRNHPEVLSNRIIEVDERADRAERIKKQTADLDVKHSIYTLLSPEKIGSETPLRELAAAWNIFDTDNMDVDQLKETLFEEVSRSEEKKQTTKRGFKEFMTDVHNITSGNTDMITLKANIQKCFEHPVILSWEEGYRCVFMKGTPIEQEIMRVSPSGLDTKFDRLIALLVNNKNLKDMVLSELIGDDVKNPITVNEELIEEIKAETNINMIRGKLRGLRLDSSGTDIKVMKDRLLNYYQK